MIHISTGNTNKCLAVSVTHLGHRLWFFQNGEQHEAITTAAAEQMRRQMNLMLEDIRREAYNEGFKDGRQKKKKKTGFFDSWNASNVGYVKG